jgi:hypothetical protein
MRDRAFCWLPAALWSCLTRSVRATLVASLLALPVAESLADEPPETLHGLPLVFADDFQSGELDRWEPTDPKAWQLTQLGDNQVYSIVIRQSDFEPPVRSPYNRSLIKDLTLGSFVLDVKLQSTLDTGAHRDLCLFFGYQDDAHFYYVHLGGKTDDHANQIFIVNDVPRTKISTKTTEGTPWTDDWHHARVVRDVESGKIEVYFDDMESPAMTANDRTFTWGRVGIGSFDDLGNFDDVRVYGEKVEPQR